MSRKNPVEELEYGAVNGLDTTTELPQMPPGFVREARNCDLGFNTGWQKRDGYKDLLVSWTAYNNFSVLQGIHYTNSSGADQELIFAINDVNDARLGKKLGTTITNLQTGLSANRRLHFAQFDDRVFAFNGDSTNVPLTYNGLVIRGFGIIATTTAPGTAETTGGSLNLLAQYGFVYKYIRRINGILKASSTPSPLAQIVLTGSNNQVDLTLIASTEVWVTNIQIYRTVADGNDLFLESEIGNVTSHSSIVSDNSLTDILEIDDSRFQDFSSTLDFPVIAQQRLFIKIGPNQGRFSKIGQEGPLPESSEVGSFYSTLGINGTRDDIIGQVKVNDTVIILKERSIGRLDPLGTPPTRGSFDNVGYTYREIDSAIGALSHDAGAEVFGEYIFLGRENVYAVNGIVVRPVANQIQETIKSFFYKKNNINKVSAINNINTKQLMFSAYKNVVSLVPDIVLIGDYKRYPAFRWTTYEPGLNATTHPGYKVGAFWEKENSNTGQTEYFFGNTDDNGKIYQINKGTDDDTSPIFFKIITRPYDMQRPLNYKLFKKAEILAQTTNPDKLLTFCSIFELNDIEEFCTDFVLPAIGGEWGDDAETIGDHWASESVIGTGVLFHSNFDDNNTTAEVAVGIDTSITDTGSIVTKAGVLQYNFTTGDLLTYPYLSNTGVSIGGISFWFTPGYTGGTASGGDLILRFSDPNGGVNAGFEFSFNHTPGAKIEIQMNTSVGVGTLTDIGAFSAIADQQYYIEIYWDTIDGKVYTFFDGNLIGGSALTLTNKGIRTAPTVNSIIRFDSVQTPNQYWIKYITTYSSVRYTTNHSITSFANSGLGVNGAPIPAGEKELIWAGQPLERLGFHFHRKAKFVQFVFSQIEIEAPVEIIGWGVEGSIFGQFSNA